MSNRQEFFVQVLYDFDYETMEGKKVWLREGEELQLLRKTNCDWWQVIRNGEKRPFYAPANYVEELSSSGVRNNRKLSRLPATPPIVDSGCDVNSNGSVCVSLSSLDALPVNSTLSYSNKSYLSAMPTDAPPATPTKDSSATYNSSALNSKRLPPKTMKGKGQLIKPPPAINESNNPTLDQSFVPNANVVLANNLPNTSNVVEQCKLLGRSKPLDVTLNSIQEGEIDGDRETVTKLKDDHRNNNSRPNSNCNDNENNKGSGCNNKDEINDTSVKDNGKVSVSVTSTTIKNDAKKCVTRTQRPRPPSPVYANFPLVSSPNPPIPQSAQFPLRCLDGGWAEFEDPYGRRYYYNINTEEKSWKPPRKIQHIELRPASLNIPNNSLNGNLIEANQKQEQQLLHCPTPTSVTMPPGWSKSSDKISGETCFINDLNKERWFTSTDERGRIYYYKENGAESFWQLPGVMEDIKNNQSSGLSTSLTTSSPSLLEGHLRQRPKSPESPPNSITSRRRPLSMADRNNKTRSMVLVEPRFIVNEELREGRSLTLPKSQTTPNITRLPNEVLRGILYKTKLVEGGKKLRKNWAISHTVLTDQSLYFFKDLKTTEINPNKAELRIDLLGANVDWASEKSSRKNVFQVTTIAGTDLQILLQEDDTFTAMRWFEAINSSIKKLPSGFEYATMRLSESIFEESKKFNSMNRKLINKKMDKKGSVGSSVEDLDCTQIEKKSKIRDKLRNFFIRRPTIESLREKGIIKEEPVFGCNLNTLCNREKAQVPKFVQRCISAIEEKDMLADGLYRASGNLSQVQRIRFQINQDNYIVLTEEDDVHVLTGALKMFFRELKEPLFPIDTFGKFLNAIALPDRKGKLKAFEGLLENFPQPNYHTLKYLLEHLLRVTNYSDQNRMHIQNLAIVFGPTLMWSSTDPVSIALDVIHQNQIIEFLLLEFSAIFR